MFYADKESESRSSHQRCSVEKLFGSQTQVFVCEYCKNFKNAYFYGTPTVAASVRGATKLNHISKI